MKATDLDKALALYIRYRELTYAADILTRPPKPNQDPPRVIYAIPKGANTITIELDLDRPVDLDDYAHLLRVERDAVRLQLLDLGVELAEGD